ncbi:hypothetical protein ACTHPF_02350 [Paenibacillus sp. SAF-054]|uniref:hypothetical protein n=1 Tax=unclassified Paenibacillus TaxID=185978 RepID=UPI003F7E40F4
MDLKLVPVTPTVKNKLSNLYQFYSYDFSPYTNEDVNTEGTFGINIDFFWEGDDRWKPYFIEQAGAVVGFLVVLLENLDIDPDPTHVLFYDSPKVQKEGYWPCCSKKSV